MAFTSVYKINGMHCASCAGIIEKIFRKTDGVVSVDVNYGTESARLSFDNTKTNPAELSRQIEKLGYSLVLPNKESKREKLSELKSMRNKVFSAMPLAVISVVIMGWDIFSRFGLVPEMSYFWQNIFQYLLPLMAIATFVILGKPYLLGVYRFLSYGRANMDTLIGIGTSVAFLYSSVVTVFGESLKAFINTQSTYFDVTIIVITFIALGKYLEARSKLKTGDAIEKLLNLQAKTALVIRDPEGKPASYGVADDQRRFSLKIQKLFNSIPGFQFRFC